MEIPKPTDLWKLFTDKVNGNSSYIDFSRTVGLDRDRLLGFFEKLAGYKDPGRKVYADLRLNYLQSLTEADYDIILGVMATLDWLRIYFGFEIMLNRILEGPDTYKITNARGTIGTIFTASSQLKQGETIRVWVDDETGKLL
jgi:hypothetical protein